MSPVLRRQIYAIVFLLATALTYVVGNQLLQRMDADEETIPIPVPTNAESRKALDVYREGAYLADPPERGGATEGGESDPHHGRIIDVHEHVQTREDALRLLEAMDRNGIQKACLLGTPLYTFTLNPEYGFEAHEKNNARILELKNEFPERFCAFVTLLPGDPGNLEKLKKWAQQGADGLKLYLGHGAAHGDGPFHTMALDDEAMLPVYEWAQSAGFPIIYHVNLIKYHDEFARVMNRYPDLRVNLPHLGLHSNSWQRLNRLAALLERFPNLYIDISYGWWVFHIQGFENLAANRTRLRAFIERFSDRVLFGADAVVESTKSTALLEAKLDSYRRILEAGQFHFYLKPERAMHGLSLGRDTLKRIYSENPARFLGGSD
jgi:predicted TIM-barrel fold metal-dependent hydrolase